MSAELIEQARSGDAEAFAELVGPYRRELQVHCYRILGSVQDAEDALQESLLSARQSFGSFQGQSSLRTWLYRVATNRSLDALRAAARRPPATATPAGVEPPEPTRLGAVAWLQPYPDIMLDDLPDSAAARFFMAIAPPAGRELRCVHTRANDQPAFAAYTPDPVAGVWRGTGLIVLTVAGDLVSDVVRFDTAVLASFGLPRILAAPPP